MMSQSQNIFLGAAALILMTLKLLDKIDWSWWKVTAPLWVPALVELSLVVIAAIFAIAVGVWKARK